GGPVEPEPSADVGLGYEGAPSDWAALPVWKEDGWRATEWDERPVCFIDGKDVGGTIAWVRSPGGYPIPVRLSEIGATVVRVRDGECRREHAEGERVVSMIVDPFPSDEVEAFAVALQEHDFRLLPATPPGGELSYEFELMRKAVQNRSNTEMGNLEEAMVARVSQEPTIIDGRLEPRRGGLDPCSSAIGVVKTIREIYL